MVENGEKVLKKIAKANSNDFSCWYLLLLFISCQDYMFLEFFSSSFFLISFLHFFSRRRRRGFSTNFHFCSRSLKKGERKKETFKSFHVAGEEESKKKKHTISCENSHEFSLPWRLLTRTKIYSSGNYFSGERQGESFN